MTPDSLSRTQRLYARRLRREQTPEEQLLWKALRHRRFAGFKFRRQHPIGPFIVDFFCIGRQLAIELDGGKHADEVTADYDGKRAAWLEARGIRELRFWNTDIHRNIEGVLQSIAGALEAPAEAPSPAPPPASRPLPPAWPKPLRRGEDPRGEAK